MNIEQDMEDIVRNLVNELTAEYLREIQNLTDEIGDLTDKVEDLTRQVAIGDLMLDDLQHAINEELQT